MPPAKINADKPHLWKADIAASVDRFNQWFMRFAPEAFRSTRVKTTEQVKAAILAMDDLRNLNPQTLQANPGALPTLRMCTAPPLAVDRLVGLASANKSLIGSMEEGKLSSRMKPELLAGHLNSVCGVLTRLLDHDIFPWRKGGTSPTEHERDRASTIVADRLCSAAAIEELQPACHRHQCSVVAVFLESLGYRELAQDMRRAGTQQDPGTFSLNVAIPMAMGRDALLPIDVLVRPLRLRGNALALVIDVASPMGRRELTRSVARAAQKQRSIQMTYADRVQYILMLGGVCDAGALGTLAAEGLDWVWQHRISDLSILAAGGH